MDQAPIALFVYNRPLHTHHTVEALRLNSLAKESDLIIFSDAAKTESQIQAVIEVREYIKKIKGFKSVSIVEQPRNLGLATSIINGVSNVVQQYGEVIVVEDDLITSKFFLQYMNNGLKKYKADKRVISIHGYSYPINGLPDTFFLRGADCWGWATWQDRWKLFEPNGSKLLQQLTEKKLLNKFDFNGTYSFSGMLKSQISGINDSWAIRWHASAFLLNKLTLYPGKSLVRNIGNDGTGTHSGNTDFYSVDLSDSPIEVLSIPVQESERAYAQFELFFQQTKGSFFRRIINKLKSIWIILF